jgi:2-amino-4-hydroxy-6-hydroxymethyldihydropteridine diphosphokinase
VAHFVAQQKQAVTLTASITETGYLALGSNLGVRWQGHWLSSPQVLRLCVQQLNTLPSVHVVKVASLAYTQPLGNTQQPCFYNTVVQIECALSPNALLRHCLQLEATLGRHRTEKPGLPSAGGPRVLDIDIISLGTKVLVPKNLSEPFALQVPHPRLEQRGFVLQPLAELAPEWVHPVSQQSICGLLQACPLQQGALNKWDDWL